MHKAAVVGLFNRQCPTCGRVNEDWTDPLAGEKTRQRRNTEDRTLAYRRWRWELGRGAYVSDVDQLEWRVVDGKPVVVAIIELSRVDGIMPVPETYQQAVLDRFLGRDAQGGVIAAVAAALGVRAYLTLFRWDLSEFWVYSLAAKRWRHMEQVEYEAWVRGLTPCR